MTRNAYVTLMCGGDGYVPGVEVLGRSLDASGTVHDKIAMITPDVGDRARRTLERRGWLLRDAELIDNPNGDALLFPRFAHVFTKLRAWCLTDYDKLVWLDADTLVLKNIDEIFERSSFAASPDFLMPDRFNSGVMLLEPSRRTFARMLDALETFRAYDGGDQGFLNEFFGDWYAMPAEHRLPSGYNMPNFIYQFLCAHPGLKTTLAHEAKVVHYLVQKPWQARATLTGASGAWWRRYFEVHPDKAAFWRRRAHSLEDWTFDMLASLVLD